MNPTKYTIEVKISAKPADKGALDQADDVMKKKLHLLMTDEVPVAKLSAFPVAGLKALREQFALTGTIYDPNMESEKTSEED